MNACGNKHGVSAMQDRRVTMRHACPQKQRDVQCLNKSRVFFLFLFRLISQLCICTFVSWTSRIYRQRELAWKNNIALSRRSFIITPAPKKTFNSHGSELKRKRGQSQGTAEIIVGCQWGCGNSDAIRLRLCELKCYYASDITLFIKVSFQQQFEKGEWKRKNVICRR